MMATLAGKISETRGENLPPLSPNLEASQLLTPLQLERITIDNPHYHDYLMLLQHQQTAMGTASVPSNQHVLNRRTAKLGDNYFFLQKDIPVTQTYARTALKLSDVRPWDQIMDRPLHSQRVIDKEVHLPFPQEHPYTSHISRFAVFPDTNYKPPPLPSPGTATPLHASSTRAALLKDTNTYCLPQQSHATLGPATQNTLSAKTASVQTQTNLTSLSKPLPAYYVHQKAGEWPGLRLEEHHLSVPGIASLNPDVGRTFWDLPRSRQHRRANTYPAPRFLYSTQLPNAQGPLHSHYATATPNSSSSAQAAAAPTTQGLVPPLAPMTPGLVPGPLPSSIHGSPPITPRTNEALGTIHRLIARTTTYADHFPGQRVQPNYHRDYKNILRLDYSLRSCVSQRPWTSESRGKYCRRIPLSPRVDESNNVSEVESEGMGESDAVVFSLLKGVESCKEAGSSAGGMESDGGEQVGSEHHDRQVDPTPHQDEAGATNKDRDVANSTTGDRQGELGDNIMVDSWTQTEEEYFSDTAIRNPPVTQLSSATATITPPQLHTSHPPTQPQEHAHTYELPRVEPTQPARKVRIPLWKESTEVRSSLRCLEASKVDKSDASQIVQFPSAKRPVSAFIDSLPTYYNTVLKPQHTRSHSADDACSHTSPNTLTQTARATRRLMTLYNGFNKTEVMKNFHKLYPEKAPDLREYSIREGKRHVICGSHAYYFH